MGFRTVLCTFLVRGRVSARVLSEPLSYVHLAEAKFNGSLETAGFGAQSNDAVRSRLERLFGVFDADSDSNHKPHLAQRM